MIKFTSANGKIITGLFAILVAFSAWQARKFEVDASADTLLMKGNQHYIASEEVNQTYESREFILVAFRPYQGSIFSNETLQTLTEITRKLQSIERVSSVRSIANVPVFSQLESIQGEIKPDELTWERKKYSAEKMDKLFSNHPLYEGLLFNETETAVSMQIVFRDNSELQELRGEILDLEKTRLKTELTDQQTQALAQLKERKDQINKRLDRKRSDEIDKIREIVQQYSDQGEFFLGGGNLLTQQLIDIIQNDLIVFGSLIAIVVCLLLYAIFKLIRWVFIPIACCSASVIMTIGLLGLLDLEVTVISANVIALQIILTLAVIVHLIVQYNELLAEKTDTTQEELVNQTMREKVKPCFYAGLTTSVGFGSLVFSGVAPVISFGWMMVIAMAVTLFVSLALFPSVVVGFFKPPAPVERLKSVRWVMTTFAKGAINRPKTIVFVSAVFTIVGIAGCFRLTAENSFLNYFSDSTDVYRELSFIDREFGGSTPLDVVYTIPSAQRHPELLITAEAVATIDDIHEMLLSKQAIGNVTSLADFATMGKVAIGKPLTEYEITALYRTLDNDTREDLLGSYFHQATQQARISARIQDTTEGLDREELMRELRHEMERLDIPQANYQLTNLFVLYQDILSRLVESQFTTVGIVYLAMAAILLLIFRSFGIALVALVPNLITTALIMGVIGLFGIPLDLMTITIASVAMGISVDDTIHYIHRYLQEVQSGAADAVYRTHLSVGYALLYTTLIIVIGFSSLVLSEFVPSILFGLLTSAAMVFAFLTDVTILPVLLKVTSTRNKTD